MIFGVLLILVGLLIAAAATMGSGTDFHLFAALNIIGLGAICCTIAHYLKPILDELRAQPRAPRQQALPRTEPRQQQQQPTQAEKAAREARWQRAVEASRSRGLTDWKNT